MEGFYFSARLDDERTLCLAPITERRLAMASEPVSDPSGYYLYEMQGSGVSARVEIIAHIVSDDAAMRLREMLKLE